MCDTCDDNRFELIKKYKQKLLDATNIEDSPEEMAVIDNILFRFWQMGWLKGDLFGNSEQLDCSDCVNHGGDWDCDHVQCRKGTDTLDKDINVPISYSESPNNSTLQPTCNQLATDTVSRAAAIDLIEEVENKRLRGEIDLTYAPMIKGIKALPPAQRWILATPETMPDSYETVYVTVSIEKRRYVTRGVVANGKWVGIFGGGRVVAWTPITYPEPYNGELDG